MKYEDMLKELEEANNGTIKLNEEYHSKLQEYINYTNQIKHISELLQEVDQIRRKYNNDETKEKVEVIDADGRKKTILKEDESEYLKLVEQKKEVTKLQQKLYSELIKMQSKKYDLAGLGEEVTKPQVTEENIYPNIEYSFDLPQTTTLVDLNEYLTRNNIRLNPLVKVKFRNGPKANLKKAFTCIKKKMSLKNFKKLLPTIFNIDKYIELGAAKLHGKLLDSGIYIRDKGVKFKNGVKQKFNKAKSFITNIPKRTANYIKRKYNDVKKYLADKKEIRKIKKEGKTTKEAMEEVYGDNKEKHLDYRIINRVANFKENTCQKVNSAKSKIITVTKSICDTIAKPFRYLRDNVRDNVKREELKNQLNKIREENLAKKRVLTNPNLVRSNSGYVGSIALITVSIVILSIIIFFGIGNMLGK